MAIPAIVSGLISGASTSGSGSGGKSLLSGLLSPGSGLISGIINKKAAGESTAQLLESLTKAEGQINQGYDQATGYYQPYYEQGQQDYQALGQAVRGGEFDVAPGTYTADRYNAPSAYDSPQFTEQYNDPKFNFNFQADPGYQFRLQEGLGAIEGSAAARGSQLSGATLKALNKYGQGLASQEYGNAYNRSRGEFESDRTFGYNRFLNNRGMYESDRNFGRGAYENDRNFGRSNYESDRGFGYGVFSDDYNRRRASSQDRYGRMSDMAQYGYNAGQNLAGLSTGRAADMANLGVQRGNVNAANTQAQAQARGDIYGGILSAAMLNPAGDYSGAGTAYGASGATNQSGVGGGNQTVGLGATRSTAYPNGVPNSTVYDTDMNMWHDPNAAPDWYNQDSRYIPASYYRDNSSTQSA